MVRDNRHDSAHLFGAICPMRGVGAAIIMPAVNAEAMGEHLGVHVPNVTKVTLRNRSVFNGLQVGP